MAAAATVKASTYLDLWGQTVSPTVLLSKTLVGDRASKASFRQEFSTRGWDLVSQSNDPRANSPKPLPVFAGVGRHHAATGHLSPHVGRGEARAGHRGAPPAPSDGGRFRRGRRLDSGCTSVRRTSNCPRPRPLRARLGGARA